MNIEKGADMKDVTLAKMLDEFHRHATDKVGPDALNKKVKGLALFVVFESEGKKTEAVSLLGGNVPKAIGQTLSGLPNGQGIELWEATKRAMLPHDLDELFAKFLADLENSFKTPRKNG